MKITSTESSPHKTNSSYGNWAVQVKFEEPNGLTGEEPRFFWTKREALEFIAKQIIRSNEYRLSLQESEKRTDLTIQQLREAIKLDPAELDEPATI